ncbi:bifunctional DNA primase/polymerase [Candidatus Pacearchaeota archaeon]|jgi:hypothetical protein|nr:bifunctional DNA primase/polymerase [Candidatus Pacearchaeota archaeon]
MSLSLPFCNDKFRFIKVRRNDKKALEDNWQDGAAYQYNDQNLLKWVETGGNVGIRGGDGNALILDLDDSGRILDKELVLPDTTSWETRPGRQQRLYLCEDWTPKILEQYVGKDKDQIKFYDSEAKDDNGHYIHLGEIQGARHYGVIPPSIKVVDGQRFVYKMLNDVQPAKISLEWLLQTLQAHWCRFSDRDKSRLEENAAKLESIGSESKKRKIIFDAREAAKKKYARTAFEDELEVLRSTSKGSRNDQLNTSALKIGTLVGSGYISRFDAERELCRVACSIGLDSAEIPATIASGLGDGIKTPRVIPDQEPQTPLPAKVMQVETPKPPKAAPKEDKESVATQLVNLADKNSVELWHTPGNDAYITLLVNLHKEHYRISSKAVKTWMGRLGRDLLGGTVSISAIKDAINALEGMAIYDGKEYQLYVRKAKYEGKIYVDLGDPDWHAIEISVNGWKVVGDCPIRFRRAKNALPLPLPTKGGNIEDLRPLINASNDDNWILTKAWLSQAFWCEGPYAHLYLRGTQGTAKSYMMACLKAISDPSAAIKRRVPKSERDTAIALGSESIPCFDNLSGISDPIADLFCVASTGGVSTQRALFTDDEEAIIPIHCPIISNGIDDLGQRGDLLDRTMVIDLDPIPDQKRKPEKIIEAEIASAKSSLLGALLDMTVLGLQKVGSVKLDNLPRMADFAEWAYACLGNDGKAFIEVYAGSRNDTKYDLVEGNRFPKAVYRLAIDTAPNEWKGAASDLLIELNKQEHILVGYEPDKWPTIAEKVGSELRRFAPALVAMGVNVTYSRSGKEGRKIAIKLVTGDSEVSPTDTKKTAMQCQGVSSDSIFTNGENILYRDSLDSSGSKVCRNASKEHIETHIISSPDLAVTTVTSTPDSDFVNDRSNRTDTTPDTIRLAARLEYGMNGIVDYRKLAAKLKLPSYEVKAWMEANYVKISEFCYTQKK